MPDKFWRQKHFLCKLDKIDGKFAIYFLVKVREMNEIMRKCILCRAIHFLTIFSETFRRDLKCFVSLVLVNFMLLKDYLLNMNVCEQFSRNVRKHPDRWALMAEDSRWTFKDVDEYSNRAANFFSGEGLKAGEEVALFMQSTPEQVMLMLGLAKIGVISAIINETVKPASLLDSISSIEAKCIIFDSEFKSLMCEVYPRLSKIFPNMKHYILGERNGCEMNVADLKEKLDTQISGSVLKKRIIKYSDKMCYIYTAGTTGFPKPTIIRHSSFNFAVKMRNIFVGVKDNDGLYNTLPVCHFMGLVMGVGTALVSGQTVVMRKKFIASDFWKDCLMYQCNVASYCGEMPRYLLEQLPAERDRDHKVRKMFGFGMRATVAKEFRERFRIDNVYEFYCSSEGNVTIVNGDKDGTCGFLPVIIPECIRNRLLPIALLQVNNETGEIMSSNGTEINCKPGDTGMLFGRIFRNNPLFGYNGYVDRMEMEKKVARDVFITGDLYFKTGDLFTMDMFGYLRFSDKLEDTFQSKGEYVSTYQTESLISRELDGVDCVVYGVELPNSNGKAVMVAVKNTKLDTTTVYSQFFKVLPHYSVPMFIRLIENVEMTVSFHYKKNALRKEGFDINVVKDPLFVCDSKNRSYVKIDDQVYNNILNNRTQF